MKIDELSTAAQKGLRAWAKWQHNDAWLFVDIGNSAEEWARIATQLRAAEDRPEWFPRGKWATLQAIEGRLLEEAKAARGA